MIKVENIEVYGWKTAIPIQGFPKYRVDTFGNVYNSGGLILKPIVSKKGYLRVSLSNDFVKHKKFLVHRLVAEAFIPNPKNLPQVNHKDENKQNNSVKNLEWCTPLENLKYSGIIEKARKTNFQKVKCLDDGKIYNSIKEVCELFGLHHSNVVACCNGRRRRCGGKTWMYMN